MEKEKNIIITVDYYLKGNIYMVKDGMDGVMIMLLAKKLMN